MVVVGVSTYTHHQDDVRACGRLFPMLGGDATFFFVIFIVAFLAGHFRWCFEVDSTADSAVPGLRCRML